MDSAATTADGSARPPQRQRLLVQELRAAVADLQAPPTPAERAQALQRLLALGVLLIGGVLLAWRWPAGWLALLPAGIAYALLLIATHEMVHGTLLGWRRGEQLLASLLSWPMAWPYNTYARLHRLHHRWNGSDGRDPERTQPLPAERARAGRLRRWIQAHPLLWRAGVLGGLGLIVETAWKGWRLRLVDRRLALALCDDVLGVSAVQLALLRLAWHHGSLLRSLLIWLVLERLIGAIVQTRGLVEHHGLWRQHGTPLLTQLYSSRSLNSAGWIHRLMGGLPQHAAHHAFPAIPAPRLPAASARIVAVLARHGLPPPPRAAGYRAAVRELLRGMAPAGAALSTTPYCCSSDAGQH